jgi:GAF domain-containing protein
MHVHGLYALHILNGERLTGWVAAHRQPIVNSDAVLDLADTPVMREVPAFNKCIAVPIVRGGEIFGALTVYSVGASEFTPEDASVVQAVADQIAIESELPDESESRFFS